MPTTEKIMTLVFDIRTLVTDHALKEDDKKYLLRKSGGMIKAGDYEHWVLPGALTLMQYLFSKLDIRVTFFNDYPKERSDELTETFLRMALGNKKYEEMAHDVRVLCENDLKTPMDAERHRQRTHYEDLDGKTKKNIFESLSADNQKPDVILIEITPEYVMLGQEDRFICSPYSSMEGLHWKTWRVNVNGWLGLSEVFTPVYFKEINTVYYLAGVLEKCIRLFRAGDDVYNFLFQLNFERRRSEFSYRYMEQNSTAYYIEGLHALQGFAPGVCYVTEGDYKELTSEPLTEAEVERLKRGESQISGVPFVEYPIKPEAQTSLATTCKNKQQQAAEVIMTKIAYPKNPCLRSVIRYLWCSSGKASNRFFQEHSTKKAIEEKRAARTPVINIPPKRFPKAANTVMLVSVFKQEKKEEQDRQKATRVQQNAQAKKHPTKTKHTTQGSVHPRRGNQR